jgi:hypothetical protein
MLNFIASIILPLCSAHIELTNLHGRDGAAGLIDGEVVIAIDYILPREEWEYVSNHELMHCLHLRNPEYLHPMFARPPFITEYAETDIYESFAEEGASYLSDMKPKNRKQRLIRRLLNG